MRKQAVVKPKEWRKPASPAIVRSTKAPTCPLTPLFHTDQRANSKRTNTVPAGYSTPVAQVL
jgi:hypothetical protein